MKEQKISLAFCIRNDTATHTFGKKDVREHNAIFAAKKAVWFGKFQNQPRPLENLHIANNPAVDATLIVIMVEGQATLKAYNAGIAEVQKPYPVSDFVPSCYPRTRNFMGWFRLSTPLSLMTSRAYHDWVDVSTGERLDSIVLQKKKRTFFVACKPADLSSARLLFRVTFGKHAARNAEIRKRRQEEELIEHFDTDVEDLV